MAEENVFEKAKRLRAERLAREAQEAEDKKNSQFSKGDYEDVQWLGIETTEKNGESKEKVFRILGLPEEVREKPTDATIIQWSKIITDKNSWKNIYSPINDVDKKPNEDWILWRMYRDVMKSDFIAYTEEEKKKKDYKRKDRRGNDNGYFEPKYQHTPSFIRIDKNRKEGSKQFGHFYPKKRVLLNVNDRMDDWCVKNKHSKILTSNLSPFEFIDETTKERKTIFFKDIGIPFQVYELIYQQVLEFRGSWDLDLIVGRIQTGEQTSYVVRDAFEDKLHGRSKQLANKEPLTKEEAEYKLYDFEKLFHPTYYLTLEKEFPKLFQQVDIDLGTKYWNELQELVKIEKEELKKKQIENESTSVQVDGNKHTSVDSEVEEFKKEEDESKRRSETVEEPVQKRRGESVEETLEDRVKKLFPKFTSLPENEQLDLIDSIIDVKDGNAVYREDVKLLACSKTCANKHNLPDTIMTCPKCAKELV